MRREDRGGRRGGGHHFGFNPQTAPPCPPTFPLSPPARSSLPSPALPAPGQLLRLLAPGKPALLAAASALTLLQRAIATRALPARPHPARRGSALGAKCWGGVGVCRAWGEPPCLRAEHARLQNALQPRVRDQESASSTQTWGNIKLGRLGWVTLHQPSKTPPHTSMELGSAVPQAQAAVHRKGNQVVGGSGAELLLPTLPLVPGAGGGSSRAGSPLQDAAVGRFAWTSRLWVQPAGSRAVGRKRRKARRSAPAVPCLFNHEEREERRWLCTVHPVYPARNSSSGTTTGCAGREDAHGHGTSIVPKSCLRWRPGEQSLASFPLKRPIRALYPHQRACFQLVSLAIMLKSHEKHSEQ